MSSNDHPVLPLMSPTYLERLLVERAALAKRVTELEGNRETLLAEERDAVWAFIEQADAAARGACDEFCAAGHQSPCLDYHAARERVIKVVRSREP